MRNWNFKFRFSLRSGRDEVVAKGVQEDGFKDNDVACYVDVDLDIVSKTKKLDHIFRIVVFSEKTVIKDITDKRVRLDYEMVEIVKKD